MDGTVLSFQCLPSTNRTLRATPGLTASHPFDPDWIIVPLSALNLLMHRRLLYIIFHQSRNFIMLTDERPGLCYRRQWPDPSYESCPSSAGFTCVVRVNNREYQTDTKYESELLARENAAMRAYLICRNFSVNDGMYPSSHNRGRVLQGLPVAIGTERRSLYNDYSDSSISSGSRSGGSSPGTNDSVTSYRQTRRGSTVSRVLVYSNRRR